MMQFPFSLMVLTRSVFAGQIVNVIDVQMNSCIGDSV